MNSRYIKNWIASMCLVFSFSLFALVDDASGLGQVTQSTNSAACPEQKAEQDTPAVVKLVGWLVGSKGDSAGFKFIDVLEWLK